MTRSEQRALEAYPRDDDKELNFRRANYRIAYERGYEQAEKDLNKKPSEDLEEAAARYERENRQSILSSVDIVDAFIAGAEWQARQLLKGSPLPEDTVLFLKGVEEGKRLMMEDAARRK